MNMKKNTYVKIITCIFITIFLSIYCIPTSHAAGNIISSGKGFLDAGTADWPVDEGVVKSTSDFIYNVLLAIAIIIAVIIGMILGIQFMLASADEKAKVKEALVPFIVGCVVVFGSFTIWKIFVNIGQDAEDGVVASQQTESAEQEKPKQYRLIEQSINWEGLCSKYGLSEDKCKFWFEAKFGIYDIYLEWEDTRYRATCSTAEQIKTKEDAIKCLKGKNNIQLYHFE